MNRLSITLHRMVQRLGPPNPWLIIIAKETLGFRCAGLSPALWLLIPAFSLLIAPLSLAAELRCNEDAPLPRKHMNACSLIFGIQLSPVEFSAQRSLASKLLRTF